MMLLHTPVYEFVMIFASACLENLSLNMVFIMQVEKKAKVEVGVAEACEEWILAWVLDIILSQITHHLPQLPVDLLP